MGLHPNGAAMVIRGEKGRISIHTPHITASGPAEASQHYQRRGRRQIFRLKVPLRSVLPFSHAARHTQPLQLRRFHENKAGGGMHGGYTRSRGEPGLEDKL
jgi:hypothetical protein